MIDPISKIEWRNADGLDANDYNPNVCFSPELRLLERSILRTGWCQPILITPSGMIIDGFHRVMLSRESAALRRRYGGECPCAVVDLPRDQAMILTIRMNRAKGTHVAVRMSKVVRELIDVHHCDRQEIAAEIGATLDEIDLLYQEGVFTLRDIPNWKYSKAWVPGERDGAV